MLNGTFEWFETVWAYTGVVIMMYYAACSVESEEDVIRTLEFAAIGFGILYLIGLFQYCGLDIFTTSFYKNIILTAEHRAKNLTINLNFPPKTVYSTLYNPDFVSLFAGPLFFIFVSLAIYNTDKFMRILFSIFSVASLVMMKGSTAISGFVAIAVTLYCVILIYFCKTKKGRIISCFVTGVLIIFTVLFLMFVPAGKKIKKVFWGTYKISDFYLTDVETTEDSAIFYTQKDELHFVFKENGFYVTDKDGNALEITVLDQRKGKYALSDKETFGEVNFYFTVYISPDGEEVPGWGVKIFDTDWVFTNQKGKQIKYINAANKWTSLKKRKIVQIFNDDAFSGRGVQWNHIIPLLKNTIFLGNGPCTYVTVYPQDDYIVKNCWRMGNQIDVKSHCWYITSAVEIGMVAVILLLVFYIIYAINALKNYYKSDGKSKWIILGVFASTFCYMVCCLSNDSTVNTSVIYWIILGLGIGLNKICKNKIGDK